MKVNLSENLKILEAGAGAVEYWRWRRGNRSAISHFKFIICNQTIVSSDLTYKQPKRLGEMIYGREDGLLEKKMERVNKPWETHLAKVL